MPTSMCGCSTVVEDQAYKSIFHFLMREKICHLKIVLNRSNNQKNILRAKQLELARAVRGTEHVKRTS